MEAKPVWSAARSKSLLYLRRRPEDTALYQIIYNYREAVERHWDELFAESYGSLRQCVTRARDEYLNCGIIAFGCARAYCTNCKHSELIAFSRKKRSICPSCSAKRSILFAEHINQNVLLPYPHRHLVFTIPKRLRLYFKARYWHSYIKPLGRLGVIMSGLPYPTQSQPWSHHFILPEVS